MRKFGILLFCLLTVTSIRSQTRQAFLDAAEKAFDSKDYYSSLHYYQTALEFDDQQIDILYKTAEAARLFNAYILAEQYYESVMDLEQNGDYPLASYYVAEVELKQGKYDEARDHYQLYLSENSGDNIYYTNRSQEQLENINWAESNSDSLDFVEIEHLGEEINTAFSEYGPFLVEDTLYYASLRFEEEETDRKGPNRVWSKELISVAGQEGQVLDSTFNQKTLHTGHVIFNADRSRMYFTLCEYKSASEIRCDIYYRDYENGQWGESMAVPFNDTAFTSTQPAIGKDPMGMGDALYFVSDRTGSKKLDIWYSSLGDAGFGAPMNLMEINTEENDITPFYHEESNVLYFSSDGYQSYGGYDIYSAYFNNGTELLIENLGTPTNSSFNDIYYYLAEDEENGYLVSNRNGAFFVDDDKEACCNDIYKLKISEVNLNLIAETYDKVTREELLGAQVKLFEISGSTPILKDSASLPNAYQYKMPIIRNRSYMLVGEKNGYDSDTVYFQH